MGYLSKARSSSNSDVFSEGMKAACALEEDGITNIADVLDVVTSNVPVPLTDLKTTVNLMIILVSELGMDIRVSTEDAKRIVKFEIENFWQKIFWGHLTW